MVESTSDYAVVQISITLTQLTFPLKMAAYIKYT